MKHLTDDQIQNYLDNNQLEGELKSHLTDCELCRLNLKAYQKLFNVLNTESLPELSQDFIQSTIKRIENPNERKWSIFENIIIAIMFSISLLISIYFLGNSNVLTVFKEIDFSFMASVFDRIINALSPTYIYLIAALLIAFMVEAFDRLRIFQILK